MILTILQDGDPILRQRALELVLPVEPPPWAPPSTLPQLVADMVETMYHDDGIGLAAPQVGEPLRLIVVSMGGGSAIAMANPVIVRAEDYQQSREGCLSVPKDKWGQLVARRKRIRVEYQDLDGDVHKLKAQGLLAACIQHEIDHLNGVLFTDYLPKRTHL
jgi:peptide deformylase